MLGDMAGDAPFLFVVGKGGTGKTTTAAALALSLADAGQAVHLISTDPAHSLRDVLGDVACSDLLVLEEFDAPAHGRKWTEHASGPLAELADAGTYLDTEDVAGLTRLALPGVDEMMAVLRLVELSRTDRRVVVDTAPTGHTLRLLDAAATHEALATALRAMADKAVVVASSLTGTAVRLRSESLIDELDGYVRDFRGHVLAAASFIIAARTGPVVEAETARLRGALRERGLHVAGSIWTGVSPAAGADSPCAVAPLMAEPPRGCSALRAWSSTLVPCGAPAAAGERLRPVSAASGEPALPWLRQRQLELWLVAGKGGVGKTTCAAALAVSLAEQGDVLLCSADPAGSLGDVLAGTAPARLRTLQIDAAAEIERLRTAWHEDVLASLEALGLSGEAALDRRVMETLWEMAPPGIDEIAALAVMLDAAAAAETIVLDAAPTGHFLRLVAMPSLALDWVHQLMRVMVKYGTSTSGSAAEALLRAARELHALEGLLHDAARAGALVVTLDEPVVQAETQRLLAALRTAHVPIAGVIVNRSRGAAVSEEIGDVAIDAPALDRPPIGASALREFATLWKIVQ